MPSSPERKAAQNRAWRRRNPDYHRNYQAAHPDQVKEYRARLLKKAPPGSNSGTPWTAPEDAIAAQGGRSLEELALELGRSMSAVMGRRSILRSRGVPVGKAPGDNGGERKGGRPRARSREAPAEPIEE